MIREVCVIGAAGRIGLVNSIVMADSMLDVIGIDINAKAVKNLQTLQATTGKIPFIETNSDLPYNVSAFKNIKFTTSFDSLNLTDVIFIIMGTPVDSEGNGNLQPLLDFFRDYVVKAIDASSDRKLIILRSTVAPGTTDCLLDMIHSMTTKRNGKDFDLAFCPERVAQGEGLTEIISLPQLIGAYTEDGYNLAAQFFSKIGSFNALPIMTPTEAEIGKLMTNMYRYVNFAFANEMYMIGRNYGADIHKVISNCNKDYPRMKMPLPGPNTGGPCLQVGTKIITPQGRRNIEDLIIGDEIYDGSGLTKVTDILPRTSNGSVTIDVRGIELISSPGHIHMVSKKDSLPTREILAKNIQMGDWFYISKPIYAGLKEIVMPKPKNKNPKMWWPESIEIDKTWARIIGLWLAEGHMCKGRVFWSFGIHETILADELISLLKEKGLKSYKTTFHVENATYGPSTTWRVRCDSIGLIKFFELLNLKKGSKHKEVPDLDGSIALYAVGGWLEGDGCQNKGTISGYSRSKELVLGMWRLLAKNNICAAIGANGEQLCISQRPDVKILTEYVNRFSLPNHYLTDINYKSPTLTEVPGGWMAQIKKIEIDDGDIEVVGIETESGRYLAEYIETHNCLYKDGKLLIETIPYCDLVQNAFIINESMPQYIFNESKKLTYTENTKIDKALILGMTFKKDNDDTRLSLSYKLKKILRKNNIEVVEGDGYIHDKHIIYEPFDFESNTIDVVYIMTPHDHLIEDYRNRLRNELRPNCVIVDVWKSLKQKETIFLNKDYK